MAYRLPRPVRSLLSQQVVIVTESLERDLGTEQMSVGASGEGAAASRSVLTRKLGSQAFVVLLGNIFTLVVGLPLQLFVARVLGAGGLGTFGILDGAVNTANSLLNLGVAPTVLRYLPAHLVKGEHSELRRLLRLATLITLVVGFSSYAVLIGALPWLSIYWPHPDLEPHTILLMGILVPIGLLLHLLQQALRGLHEIKYMILGSSVLQLSLKALVFVGAVYVGLKLDGYVLATVLATAFGMGWMALGLKRKLKNVPTEGGAVDPQNMSRWSRYALVYTGNSVVASASAYLDRFLLVIYFSTGLVGVLVVVRQLQQLPQALNQMLLLVSAPMFVDAHAQNDPAARKHLFALMTDWVVKASLPLIMFLAIYADDVLNLFGSEFAEQGTPILWIFLVGQLISLASGPLGLVANMSGLEVAIFRISTIGVVLVAALMFLLVPVYGLYGVAAADLFHHVMINGWFMLLLRQRFRMKWWDARYLSWILPSLLTGGLGLGAAYLNIQHGMVMLAVLLIAMYSVFGIAAYLQGLQDDELEVLNLIADRLMPGRVRGDA